MQYQTNNENMQACAAYLNNLKPYSIHAEDIHSLKNVISMLYTRYNDDDYPVSVVYMQKMELLSAALNFLKSGFIQNCIKLLIYALEEKAAHVPIYFSLEKAIMNKITLANEIIKFSTEDFDEIENRHYLISNATQKPTLGRGNDNVKNKSKPLSKA